MAANRGRNRAKDFEDFLETAPADFDPEINDEVAQDSNSEAESAGEGERSEAAREHYRPVSKSKLKQTNIASLGPQYRGSRVARKSIMEEDEDDPFTRDFGEESSSEEDGADSDLEDGEEQDEASEEDIDDEGFATDITEDSDEQEEEKQTTTLAEQRMEEEQQRKAVTSTIQLANKADAEKGRAVQQQSKAFDSLLNTRIKLQKALIGTNSVAAIASEDLQTQKLNADAAIQAAEEAAYNLWSALDSFREELQSAKTGSKRKRSFSIETPTSDLLSHLQSQDAESDPRWKTVLQTWFLKTRNQSTISSTNRLNNTDSIAPQTITDILNQHLSSLDHLLIRAQTPRSCAPIQAAQQKRHSPQIYDDADFYGQLLKNLLEQKSQDAVSTAQIDLSFQLRRENKTKKVVDTKASKGRKLRYTVHEKLQNFMAPEDRRKWGERQADELFGSLFGRRLALEDDERDRRRDDEDEEMDGERSMEEDGHGESGLRLFR